MRILEAKSAEVHRLRRSDREIVEGILDGDPAAARALVDKYGRGINARVWRMLGADPDHDDVVQQVLVGVLRSIPKLKDPAALRDWIGRITVNTVLNELRSRRLRRMFRPTETLPEVASDDYDPEAMMIARRGVEILNSLRDRDRVLFVMRYMEGASLKEIVRCTGCSLATVKRRLVRVREAFLKKASRDNVLASLFREGARP